LTIDDYMLFNANATYRFGNEQQYAVSIFGNNLTDEHFCGGVEAPDGSLLLSSGGPAQATALHMNVTCRTSNASTRTYGVSFGYEF
jgi:iron complex outermembrane receptor protein